MAEEITRRLLIEAGITNGMRVLDVGCGSGDVSFLVAHLVGENGEVVGVDRDPRALSLARDRAQSFVFPNVRFIQGDFDSFTDSPDKFDAVVGRRVLMYQPDAVAALHQLSGALRPGALIFFQEHDSATIQGTSTSLPLHQQVRAWIWETVKREGANIHMGFGLATALKQAGFTVDGVRAEATIITPTQLHHAATIVKAMLPRIVGHGVATEQQIDIETLDQRLTDERINADTTFLWELIFGAWARKPD